MLSLLNSLRSRSAISRNRETIVAFSLAPGNSVGDYGYVAGLYGSLTGTNSESIASIVANATDMRVTLASGLQLNGLAQLWLVWDENEIILDWNVAGYYINAVDHQVFADHFSRQLAVPQLLELEAPPTIAPQVEVWERSASGSLQGYLIRMVQDGMSNDATWLNSETIFPDAFGTNYACRQADGIGNQFMSGGPGLILANGGTAAVIGKFETGSNLGPCYINGTTLPSLQISHSGTAITVKRDNPTVIIATVSNTLTVGQHAIVVTVVPDGLGNALYTVYVDGASVWSGTDILVNITARLWFGGEATISQLIRDDTPWTAGQVAAHYNGGSFQPYSYPANVVGVVHGDSLTNSPNNNTWYDTVAGLRLKYPAWTDYLRRLHGKQLLGNGFDSRKIESANVTLQTIQRFSFLPAGTRHFLYLGFNNFVVDPVTTTAAQLQSQLLAAIAVIEAQNHEAVLFKMPPCAIVTTDLTNSAAGYAAYDEWLTDTMAPLGYKVIDPKVVLANPGTRVLKSIYNTLKSGAVRNTLDEVHYNNYGHRDLAAYIAAQIDSWG